MKLTKQHNFEILRVVAKNISISGSKMNGVLWARISFKWLWLVLNSSLTTGRFDYSVSLKSRQNQKHPPSIELETQCNVPHTLLKFFKLYWNKCIFFFLKIIFIGLYFFKINENRFKCVDIMNNLLSIPQMTKY